MANVVGAVVGLAIGVGVVVVAAILGGGFGVLAVSLASCSAMGWQLSRREEP